jgi:hypothetical protein
VIEDTDVDYDVPSCRCGRLDEHPAPHNWSAPQGGVGIAPARITYICWGPPVIEGGSPASQARPRETKRKAQ